MKLRRRTAVLLALLVAALLALWSAWGDVRTALAAGRALAGAEPALPAGAARRGESPRAARSPSARDAVRLEPVATGLSKPLFVTHAGDGSGRLFVVEQTGAVRILRAGRLLERPFLDLSREIDTSSGERGLLGLAFAPDYRLSGRLYVAHTVRGHGVVVRYRVSDDPDRVDPRSREVVLDMDDPAGNHNGGMLLFGPDGNLWIGTGDGGSAGDPWDNARNPQSLLGKMLRIDVSGPTYTVPPDNPFARQPGHAPEVWALGLRNPWRYSFDRTTGELWIGDVGQNAWEEIDVVDPGTGGGTHFGWKTMEGFHCYTPRSGCETAGLTLPVHAYSHRDGCSVTGGYVYRGAAIPALAGAYLFGDYCNGRIWTLRRDGNGRARTELRLESGVAISSFGEDADGELYLCDHGGGRILRLVAG
ncbi:MAG: sorbosone dehydrogenase family protein [Thermoanaerobaculia bacterium]